MKFPDEGIAGYYFKPQIGFFYTNSGTLRTMLEYYNSYGYKEFKNDSQIWFKFSNGVILKTGMLEESQDGPCNLLNSGYFQYCSLAIYRIDLDGILNQLSEKNNYVEKIRIIFSTYDYQDYIIKKGYRKRFKKNLVKSLKDSSWFQPEEF